MTDDKVLAGITTLFLVLIVGAVLGRSYGSADTKNPFIGDRVACGLFALPLISMAVCLAFPHANIILVLLAPAPLAIYIFLLAVIDTNVNKNYENDKCKCLYKIFEWVKHNQEYVKDRFTAILFLSILIVYIIMAVVIFIIYLLKIIF